MKRNSTDRPVQRDGTFQPGDFSRRDTLAAMGTGALLSLTRCAAPAMPPVVSVSAAVDSHCHVFNGKDIPAAQFVLRVAAREEGFEDFEGIAAFAVSILRSFAPTAQQEIQHLSGAGSPDLGRANFRRQIGSTLQSLQQASQTSSTTSFENSPTVQRLRQSRFRLPAENLQLNGVHINAEALALATLRKHYPAGASPTRRGTAAAPSNEDLLMSLRAPASAARTADLSSLADSMVADAGAVFSGTGGSVLGQYLALIGVFLSYRSENVSALDAALGLAQANQYRMYCPALVDYDCWLGATIDGSQPLADQAEVMERVSRTTGSNVLVAGYMAFDPLRAVLAKIRNGSTDQSVLATVKSAVEQHGFLGAKLYPPMGFRAWNNATNPDTFGYPDTVKEALRTAGANPDTFDLGSALDTALDELYQYCLGNDVPILAHCGNSQTAFDGAGVRASPYFWEQLLKRPGYSGLRINLGHFGGLWCAAEDLSKDNDESVRCRVSLDETAPPWLTAGPNAWPTKIMQMISATDSGGNALHPNLVCDIADVGALDDTNEAKAITTLLLRNSAANTAQAHKHILYGTDWMFLIRSDNYQNFARNAQLFAGTLGIDPTDLMGGNARRFLGLVPGGKATARLQAFYASDAQRLNVLNQFVGSAPP